MDKQETILIVDDERYNINVLVNSLSSDYKVVVAKNGEQALKRVSTVMPDLILLDVIMPDMGGYEVCRQIKSNPETEAIPIIFISALDQVGDEQKGLELGAVDYITKPFSPLLVNLRVVNQLKLKRQSDLLRDLATYDGLTGIPNRRRFDEVIRQEWRSSIRNKAQLSLIMIDIDYFKLYNDEYGHVGGDDCLTRVAQALAQACNRGTDIICRYGGEEFACILPDTDTSGAQLVGEQLIDAVSRLKIEHKKSAVSGFVTLSMGVATMYAKHGSEAQELISYADENLYLAKKQGRNRLVV